MAINGLKKNDPTNADLEIMNQRIAIVQKNVSDLQERIREKSDTSKANYARKALKILASDSAVSAEFYNKINNAINGRPQDQEQQNAQNVRQNFRPHRETEHQKQKYNGHGHDGDSCGDGQYKAIAEIYKEKASNGEYVPPQYRKYITDTTTTTITPQNDEHVPPQYRFTDITTTTTTPQNDEQTNAEPLVETCKKEIIDANKIQLKPISGVWGNVTNSLIFKPQSPKIDDQTKMSIIPKNHLVLKNKNVNNSKTVAPFEQEPFNPFSDEYIAKLSENVNTKTLCKPTEKPKQNVEQNSKQNVFMKIPKNSISSVKPNKLKQTKTDSDSPEFTTSDDFYENCYDPKHYYDESYNPSYGENGDGNGFEDSEGPYY